MGKTALKYTFITIGVYLAAAYATGLGKALSSAGGVYVQGVKALQGR